MNKIGENIRKERLKNKMTQSELANLLGVSDITVSRYDTGQREPNIDTLFKLSDVFHIGVDDLIGLQFDMNDTDTDIVQNEFDDSHIICLEISEEDFDKLEKSYKLLSDSLSLLNVEGKTEAAKRVEELTHIDKYQKEPEK